MVVLRVFAQRGGATAGLEGRSTAMVVLRVFAQRGGATAGLEGRSTEMAVQPVSSGPSDSSEPT